jgi:hypothetical protein
MTSQSQPLKNQPEAKLSLGRVVATPGACQALDRYGTSYSSFLDQHVAADWGDICVSDARANEQALLDNTRLLSCYTMGTSGSGSLLNMIVPPPVFFCHASTSGSIRHGIPSGKSQELIEAA